MVGTIMVTCLTGNARARLVMGNVIWMPPWTTRVWRDIPLAISLHTSSLAVDPHPAHHPRCSWDLVFWERQLVTLKRPMFTMKLRKPFNFGAFEDHDWDILLFRPWIPLRTTMQGERFNGLAVACCTCWLLLGGLVFAQAVTGLIYPQLWVESKALMFTYNALAPSQENLAPCYRLPSRRFLFP